MVKPAIHTVEIEKKKRRSDGGVDLLAKAVLKNGNIYWIAVRKSPERLTACHEIPEKREQRGLGLSPNRFWNFVSCPSSRILKTALKTLYREHPEAFIENRQIAELAYHRLREDQRKEKTEMALARRQWRVHELAIFEDNNFVARLSCNEISNLFITQSSQFVIHSEYGFASRKRSGKKGFNSIVSKSLYGNQTTEVNLVNFIRYLEADWRWPYLSEVLKEISHGYNTEVDARKHFEAMANLNPWNQILLERKTFDVANSVRQAGSDRDTQIEIIDSFNGYSDQNWLLKTDKGYLVLAVNRPFSGVPEARFIGEHGRRIAFESPIATCRRLLPLARPQYLDAEEAQKLWEGVIAEDLERRYSVERISAEWVFQDWASLKDGRLALRATCLYPLKAAAPMEFPRPCYVILVTGKREILAETEAVIYDLASGKHLFNLFSKKDPVEEFKGYLKALGTIEGREAEHSLQEHFLRHSRGYLSKEEADMAWQALTSEAEIHHLCRDVTPLPPHIRTKLLHSKLTLNRNAILERKYRPEDEDLRQQAVARYDENVRLGLQHPEKILHYGERMGWITREGDAIRIVETPSSSVDNRDVKAMDDSAEAITPVRYENHIDKKAEIDLTPAAPSTTIPDLRRDEKQVDDISSLQNSSRDDKIVDETTVGRPRKWEDDRERKREWARRHRKKLQAEKALSKEPQPKRGRPAIYESPAERQRAYRKRKKLQSTSSAKD